MPRQLLDEAIEQSHQSSPSVRAMALLHIARVLTALDRMEAKRTLGQALAEIDALPATDREPAMNDIVSLIATVSPEQAFLRLPLLERGWRQADWMLRNMLDHGHKAEVIAYLADPLPGMSYPSMAMLQTLAHCRQDPEAQRTILRGGIRAMRSAAEGETPHAVVGPERSEFVRAFVNYWKILPREEAAQFLHEYVDRVLREPDDRSDCKFSLPTGTVRFSSKRQRELFEILGPLRELEPVLTDSLIRDHDQLAKAAALLPRGLEEYLSTETAGVAPSLPIEPMEWDEVNYGWIPVSLWLETAYPKLLNAALNRYAIDTAAANPNRAPREIWPSTQSFRALLYRVGRHEGRAATARLEGIPDDDLRLFAKIELAAALAGLKAFGGTEQPPGPLESAEEYEPTSLDLAAVPIRWNGRGRAKQVRAGNAEWDRSLRQWSAPQTTTTSLYTPDSLLIHRREEHENGRSSEIHCDYDQQQTLQRIRSVANEKTTTFDCSYDQVGQLVRVTSQTLPEKQEPSDYFDHFQMAMVTTFEFRIGDEGLKIDRAAAVSIGYDEKQRPVEVSFFDEKQSPLGISRRKWSASGTLASEEFTAAQPVFLDIEEDMDDQAMASMRSPWVTMLTYDERGRCKQRETTFSGNMVYKVEAEYDDLGNPVQQRITDPGSPGSGRELRYDYLYDAIGNWTERVIRTRLEGGADFEFTSIERREIHYF
jgi:hypothetical protein